MPPRPTGVIETHPWKDGRTETHRARVRAYGRQWRVHFGTNHEGWSEERARVELDGILAKIERGTWEPPAQQVTAAIDELETDETVHITASRWWQKKRPELQENAQKDYRWRLDYVLRYLAHTVTAELSALKIDEFRQQLRSHGLAPRSQNMVLDVLAMILDEAVEYGLLDANPARGKRRRAKVSKQPRTFLEPDMVVDLLDAAGEWERELPPHQRYGRRAFLATLCLAGPRISEVTERDRGQLDAHAGELRLGNKTAAGIDRHLELSAFLAAELRVHLAAVPAHLPTGPDLPIFPTWTGGRLNPSNVRNRLLKGTPARNGRKPIKGVVQRVNEKRSKEGRLLLPDRVTPHTLRRTFASLCFFVGRDLRWVMGQLGHDDPRMTLAVYAQCMKRTRIDHDLVWRLMRFPDEPKRAPRRRSIETWNETTGPSNGGQRAAERTAT